MRLKLALIGCAVRALMTTGGCKGETRDRECGEWADWSNAQDAMVVSDVSMAERDGANTNAKQAANYRKFAAGARQAAGSKIPFQDPKLRDGRNPRAGQDRVDGGRVDKGGGQRYGWT